MIIPRQTYPFYFAVSPEWAHARGAGLVPGVLVRDDATWCTRDKVEVVAALLECPIQEGALEPWDRIDAEDWPGLSRYDAEIAPRARAYQPQASVFMAARSSAMNCDEMRLGKNMETYGAAMLVGAKQVVIATTGTPKRGWGEDAATWYKSDALMLDGRAADDMWWFCSACTGTGIVTGAKPSDDAILGGAIAESARCERCRGRGFFRPDDMWEALCRAPVIVCNYDILIPHREENMAGMMQYRGDLPGWVRALRKWGAADTIVLDESHKIGEKGARHHAVRELCGLSTVRRVWATTGTPDDGRLIKLWSQLDLISGRMWGTRKAYASRYANGYQSDFGFKIPKNGRSPLADTELADMLRHVKYGRTKFEVAPHLPQISRQVLRLEIKTDDGDQMAAPTFAGCEALLNRTAKKKLAHGGALDFILSAMREGHKLAIFVRNRDTGHVLGEQIAKACRSTREVGIRNKRGDVWDCIGKSTDARVKMADAFSAHLGAGVFVATIDGFQTGRSLHGVAYNVFVDLHWDPNSIYQCEKRADTFERPTGLISVFIILANSGDEHVVSVLLPKLDALWNVYGSQAARDFRDTISPQETLEQVWARHVAHLRKAS